MSALIGRATDEAAVTLISPLRWRDFRLAVIGRLFSLAGNAAQSVTLAVLVLDITQRPSGWGTVLTIQAIPQVLLMLAGGVVIDRFRSRSVLLASNLLFAVTLAALLPGLLLGTTELWHLYVYAVVSGVVFAFYIPASQAMVPELVPREQVRSANALWIMAFHSSRFVGPPIAVTLAALGGHALAIGAIVGLLVVGSAVLVPVRVEEVARAGRASMLEELVEGFRVARADPVVWVTILAAAIYNLGASGATLVGLPSLAKLALAAGDEGVGLLFAALGAGALAGILVTGSVARIRRQAAVGAVTNLGMGAALIAAAFASSIWVAIPLLFVAGAFQAAGGVIFLTLMQTRVPAAVRGRVMALLSLSLFGLTPLAYGLSGFIGDALGPRGILVAGGATVVLCGVMILSFKVVREVE
jgi:MFS family permease